MSTTQREPSDRLQPDHARISNAFAILSEELPRLSNLDANGIIQVLETLQTEVKNNMQTQQAIITHLDNQLLLIRANLNSLDGRLERFESLATRGFFSDLQSLHHADDTTSSHPIAISVNKGVVDTRMHGITTTPAHDSPSPTPRLNSSTVGFIAAPSDQPAKFQKTRLGYLKVQVAL